MKLAKKIQLYPIPVYPLLLGLYPVLYLWSANRIQQPAYVLIPSFVGTLLALLLVYLAAIAVLRNVQRAALSTAVINFITLSYGHFMTLTRQWGLGLQHRYMLPAVGIFMLGLLILVQLLRSDYRPLTKILNLVTAVLVAVPLFTAGAYYLPNLQNKATAPVLAASTTRATQADPETRRDIYFIILDNYGRQDHLLEREVFDNSELVTELKQRGFIFPDCAQGNYPGTAPVVASILTMNYLDDLNLTEVDFLDEDRYSVLTPYIHNSPVIQKFRSYSYHTVTFRGFMDVIDIQDTDTYISFDKNSAYQNRLETFNFQNLYFQTTLLHPINEKYKIYPDWLAEKGPRFLFKYLPHHELLEERFLKVYEQNVYGFDQLEQIPVELESPKFVYAHLYSTHWPYMLRPDGTMRLPFTEAISTEGYLDGVRYTNRRIIQAIDSILANSKVKPVIILQGDHANGTEEGLDWSGKPRLEILSAYYLPDGGEALLSDTISPVNNFRLIFKHYFGESIELLPDVNYYLDRESKKLEIAPKSCISDPAP